MCPAGKPRPLSASCACTDVGPSTGARVAGLSLLPTATNQSSTLFVLVTYIVTRENLYSVCMYWALELLFGSSCLTELAKCLIVLPVLISEYTHTHTHTHTHTGVFSHVHVLTRAGYQVVSLVLCCLTLFIQVLLPNQKLLLPGRDLPVFTLPMLGLQAHSATPVM